MLALALVLASLVTTRFKWGPAATKLVTHTINSMQEIELIDWKPNSLKFCIKVVLLSHDELTMVKQEEVIHSSKVSGLCTPQEKWKG